ncbi:hypothetical protein TTHERM_00686020 (macronuclear) [Tetrahymena thermophila SB210]|uniref:Uncharacterized protein n=1 Tax=Tetrahymena thermophila (strain SB210) TaxID=312017 RepID=I7M459_TETTS|nr:hypothetical protein TTHERM_00686020 [Tetrahymena thermophila SB210]EAS04959.1 hypothetical protein TTHERM_00686020 [Tetrahymena thermophila SB210]|eukprot:XP_001025204.1 hypothetical protein TTHERM_00686020 [Tetrahymena thermophila SB210]
MPSFNQILLINQKYRYLVCSFSQASKKAINSTLIKEVDNFNIGIQILKQLLIRTEQIQQFEQYNTLQIKQNQGY